MKQGRGLEQLVAHLERILINDPGVKIHSPKTFPDLVTGRPREHDVVLEIVTGHHTNFVALECRERSRPVGVNQVEGFAKKCEHTGISKGILVSQKGFYKPALVKANALKISCFTLEQVGELTTGNLLMSFQTFTFHNTDITDIRFEFVQADAVVRDPNNIEIISLDGSSVSSDRVRQNAIAAFRSLPPEFDKVGEYEKRIEFKSGDMFILDISTGEKIRIIRTVAIVKYTIESTNVPYQYFKYSDSEKNQEIGGFAIAKGKVSGSEVGIVLSSSNGQVSISLIADVDK